MGLDGIGWGGLLKALSKWSRMFETQHYFPLKKLVRLQVPGSRAAQAGRQASGLFRFPQHHEGNERHEKQVWQISPKLLTK